MYVVLLTQTGIIVICMPQIVTPVTPETSHSKCHVKPELATINAVSVFGLKLWNSISQDVQYY